MLLTVDIGNTNITFGVFKGRKLLRRFDIPTKEYSAAKLKRKLKNKAERSIICSVVPKATKLVAKDLAGITGLRPYIIGKGLKVAIRNLYRKPLEVGQDRLVNAYAAIKLFGAPAIVIDCGTAVTFDVISAKGEYLGGMILPGLNISLEALNEKTALLPKVKLTSPRELIGRDTKNSILSGIVYGMAASIDDLTYRIRQGIGKRAVIIGTGGNIGLLSKYSRSIMKLEKNLTLKGLRLIAEANEKK